MSLTDENIIIQYFIEYMQGLFVLFTQKLVCDFVFTIE